MIEEITPDKRYSFFVRCFVVEPTCLQLVGKTIRADLDTRLRVTTNGNSGPVTNLALSAANVDIAL